jgi:hypothetical protein
MNPNHPVPTSEPKEASAVQAGSFSLLSLFLRVLSGLGKLTYNFAPVGGLGVFTGARVRGYLAYVFPLAVMLATDLIIYAVKQHPDYSPLHYSRPFVYGSFAVYVLLGRWLGSKGLVGLGAAAVVGSVQFFLLTNFGSWLLNPTYSRDLVGLMDAYKAGLPFYRADNPMGFFLPTLLSDVCFTFGFVAAHVFWVKATQPTVTEKVSPS